MSNTRKAFIQKAVIDSVIRKKCLEHLHFRRIFDIKVTHLDGDYNVVLETTKARLNIGTSGSVIEETKRFLLGLPLVARVNLDVKEVSITREVSAKLINERLGSMLLAKINFKRAVARILQLLREAGVQGAKVTLKGPLQKIRQQEYSQSIGNYRAPSEISEEYQVCKQSYVLPGGLVGIEVTIVFSQDVLPDQILLLEDHVAKLESELQGLAQEQSGDE